MPTIITKIGQYQGASTRQMPAAHLTRTMQLLEKTCNELDTELANEISENPALEMAEECRCPDCKQIIPSYPCQVCLNRLNGSGPIVYVAPRSTKTYSNEEYDEYYSTDNKLKDPETLSEHILKQVAPK